MAGLVYNRNHCTALPRNKVEDFRAVLLYDMKKAFQIDNVKSIDPEEDGGAA